MAVDFPAGAYPHTRHLLLERRHHPDSLELNPQIFVDYRLFVTGKTERVLILKNQAIVI